MNTPLGNDPQKVNWQQKKIKQSKAFQFKAFEEVNNLVIKERCGKYITLTDGSRLREFITCSYLGLDCDPSVIQASTNHIYQCGVTFSCARTRARVESFVILEKLLNKIFCNGYSTTFASLHLGHLGVIPLFASGELPSFPMQKHGPVFILDKTVHASIQILRGIMNQFGQITLIDFKDKIKLEELLRKNHQQKKTSLLFSDSIGSMGGVAPIAWLIEKAEQYNAYVYLDDAHGTSIHGKHGAGYVLKCLNHQFHPRLILASSLAKAFGAIAGVIIVPSADDEIMIKRFASTYVFGGPPALAIIDAAIASAHIHLSKKICELQNKLWNNVGYFDSFSHEQIVNIGTLSPIRSIYVGDEFKAIQCAKKLREYGFAVTTAMYPTVALGHSMLRIALSAIHTQEDIRDLHHAIQRVLKEI